MMKQADCSTATALIIQGYMRANSEDAHDERDHLRDAVAAIRRECSDWAENLAPNDTSALEPDAIEIGLMHKEAPASRAPYTLVSAAIALLREAIDLNGPQATMRDFLARAGIAEMEKA